MKTLLGKTAILLAPMVVWVVTVLVADPYNYYRFDPAADAGKKRLFMGMTRDMAVNYSFYLAAKFRANPAENVLLGDSRVYGLDERHVEEVSGERYFNFGIPGGGLRSSMKAFWFAASHAKLKNVYLAASFHSTNDRNKNCCFDEVEDFIGQPLLYPLNSRVRNAVIASLKNGLRHPGAVPERTASGAAPPLDEENWNKILLYLGGNFAGYQYPDSALSELQKIAMYCRDNRINLKIIVFPHHSDFRNVIAEKGMELQESRFYADLVRVADVYFYDYPNFISCARENYQDPTHLKPEVMNRMIEEIWGKKAWCARFLSSRDHLAGPEASTFRDKPSRPGRPAIAGS